MVCKKHARQVATTHTKRNKIEKNRKADRVAREPKKKIIKKREKGKATLFFVAQCRWLAGGGDCTYLLFLECIANWKCGKAPGILDY